MIILGTDVSGHVGAPRHARYIGFVLGTEEGINHAYRLAGARRIHMASLSDNKRNKIINKMEFDGDMVCMCAYVEKQRAIDSIFSDPKFNQHKSKQSIRRHFGYLLWGRMRSIIEPFAAAHKCEVRDIVVQCDSDMRDTVNAWGMNVRAKGKAYELADAVAWCNSHGKRPKTCREFDWRTSMFDEMKRDLLK